MVVVVGAWVVVVVGAVAVVVGAEVGSAIVGMSNDASCVSGAWEADTRNSPPTRSMITAAGLVRRSVQRRLFMRYSALKVLWRGVPPELFDSRLPNPFGTAGPFVGECRVRDAARGFRLSSAADGDAPVSAGTGRIAGCGC